jgi:hypothetical protein
MLLIRCLALYPPGALIVLEAYFVRALVRGFPAFLATIFPTTDPDRRLRSQIVEAGNVGNHWGFVHVRDRSDTYMYYDI